jgi:flavorubredoxin
MVALTDKIQHRLTMQVEIAPNTTAIRSLDWNRDRFDIEFGLQNGTTYNSF